MFKGMTAVPIPLGSVALWNPSQPTTDGGVLSHTWQVPGVANFQDAAKTTPADTVGDVVGAVVNQGSDIYDVTQVTTANKPTLQQVTINGVVSYVWRFDGVDDFLRGAFGGGAISQPYTVFAVAMLTSTVSAYRQITDGPGFTNRMSLFQRVGSTWAVQSGTELIDGASNTNWNLWTYLANGASSQFWHNGVSKTSGNAGVQSLTGLVVGANTNGSGGYWIGDIGQILIYPGNLSTADKNQIGGYLERVTGITWTTIV